METVKLMIELPEETYEYWKNHSYEYVIAEAIAKGILLDECKADEYILREDALNCFTVDNTKADAWKAIKALPSVYAKSDKPSGKWIEHFDESGKWYECDQCHTDWGGAVNFCPYCGAKMTKEQTNEID